MHSLVPVGICLIIVLNVASTEKHHPNIFAPSRKWITELFFDVQKDFSMELAINPKCISDYRIYLSHLRNQSVWAVRMKESSEWPSVGLYSGMVDHLGNWAECLRSSGPEGIQGKYCIAQVMVKEFPVNYDDSAGHHITMGSECEDCSAWSMMRMYSDDTIRAERRKIQWAVCMPSSCSSEDLKKSLENIMTPIFNNSDLPVEVKVPFYMCSTNVQVPEKYPKGYYVTGSIFLSLIILVIAATLKDIFIKKCDGYTTILFTSIKSDIEYVKMHRTKGKQIFTVYPLNSTSDPLKRRFTINLYDNEDTKGLLGQSLACFSVKQSFRSLTESTDETRNPIYFMKTLFFLFIAAAHRWIVLFLFPIFQAEEVEKDYASGKLFFMSQLNGVDVFFVVSGLLFYRFSIQPMKKIGFPFIGLYIVFRHLKTIPIHGMTIAFVSHIFPHLSDGPFWKFSQIWISGRCKTYWLSNLLKMNNFNGVDGMCLAPSWYLAADFQISVIGVFLLFVLIKNRRLGMILIGICFILSTMSTGLVAYFYKVNGFHMLGIKKIRDPGTNFDVNKMYFSFYPRLSPFLLGMMEGMVVEKAKKKNYKPSQTLSLFIFSLSVALAILVQYHGFTLASDKGYSIEWRSIFTGLYRPLYVLPYVVVGVIYFTSGIGFVDYLFTRKIFFALGRLGLSFLFSSYVFQLYHVASQRSLMPTSSSLNIYMWSIADIIIALPIAFFFYLIVDGPCSNLVKLLKIELIKSAYLKRLFETKSNNKMKTK